MRVYKAAKIKTHNTFSHIFAALARFWQRLSELIVFIFTPITQRFDGFLFKLQQTAV